METLIDTAPALSQDAAQPAGTSGEIAHYLRAQQSKSLLRFITCGSVDDGKSTLIGRLLYESKMLFEDQLAQLEADSKKMGTQGDDLDFALLVDGLAAEREQGITIDVAYRFFATDKRKFIVADTPGHEQYTRNMVTGASTADLAILLVDARRGVQTQTRRHSYLVATLGIRRVVLAVNKLDMVGYSREVHTRIENEYREFARQIGLTDITCIPMSALRGDNITEPSAHTPWYHGPTLMAHLEDVPIDNAPVQGEPFRLPVQWVNRPNLDFRGFAGTVSAGESAVATACARCPRGARAAWPALSARRRVRTRHARPGPTLTLEDEIDISRGGRAGLPGRPAGGGRPVRGHAGVDERGRHAARAPLPAQARHAHRGRDRGAAKYKVNVNTLEHLAARTLELNEIGVCNLHLDQPVAFDPYARNRELGGFIIIDRLSNNTVGAGMLHFALRRAQNVHWQAIDVDRHAHAALKHQSPRIVWFTGLSGAGKSTIANLVEKRLHALGHHTCLLDGDNVRHGLNKDLGFAEADRVENIRRVAEVARLMLDAGLIVLVSFISPFRSERDMARALAGDGDFVEVFIDTPLAVAEQRDPKGLYRKARRGELKNFTGIDSPYQPPERPEIRIDTTADTAEQAAERIVAWLREKP